MYVIEIHEDAVAELASLRPYERNRILDEIEEQLTHEPTMLTRHKKVLEALQPPWDQLGPVWQLRVEDYRVYYDVIEKYQRVIVRSVRRKPPHRTTEKIL